MGKKIIPVVISIVFVGLITGISLQWKKAPKKVEGVSTVATPTTLSTPEWTTPKGKFYAPILAYHHLALRRPQNSYYVSPEIFDEQLKWLKDNGYQVVSFDEFYAAAAGTGKLPPKPAVITFDDGNVDNYTNAFPILKKYSVTATFFIKINGISKSDAGMNWAKLKEMTDAGMTIGSHSVNHNNMSKMDDETLAYELVESKKILEKNLGIKIKYFAYPGGAYSKKTIEAAKAAGYLAAVTTKHKVYQEIKNDDSLFTLPRVHIDDEIPTFIDWVQGKNLY